MALTLTTSLEIERMAGRGKSSDISGSEITDIGEKAEGILCSDTRRDWIADYAAVNSKVKEMINHATAAKAAQIWVNYDGSGYFSRLEQLQIMNFLDNEYNKTVEKLSKIDANDIRGVTA